jgi:hypothetical protein
VLDRVVVRMNLVVGPWEHPNILTWVRRCGMEAIATVSVSPDGKAMGVVKVDGQVLRRNFGSADLAKTWCDGKLEGKPVAAPVPVAPTPAPAPAPPAPPPAAPAVSPTERLLRVLRNDPDLAWEVAVKARSLGPWVMVTEMGSEQGGWYQRSDASGSNIAVARENLFPSRRILWSEFVPVASSNHEITMKEGFATIEDAMADCDTHLRTKGWLLATRAVEQP